MQRYSEIRAAAGGSTEADRWRRAGRSEAADVQCVSTKTVQRRLNRALVLLAESLRDLEPGRRDASEP